MAHSGVTGAALPFSNIFRFDWQNLPGHVKTLHVSASLLTSSCHTDVFDSATSRKANMAASWRSY